MTVLKISELEMANFGRGLVGPAPLMSRSQSGAALLLLDLCCIISLRTVHNICLHVVLILQCG